MRQDQSSTGVGQDVVSNCSDMLSAPFLTVNSRGHRLSGIFGYTELTGGYPGDQAEYCRVPNADLVLVKAPKEGVAPGKLLGLADVTTTAWHGCELAEIGKGDTVAVWGCGPVGLSIQRLSLFRGASKVYGIDPDPDRLKIAASFGSIPVNVTEHKDVSDYLLQQEPHGVDKSVEASGFRSAQSWIHSTMRTIGKIRYPSLLVDQCSSSNFSPRRRRRPVRHRHCRNQIHSQGRKPRSDRRLLLQHQ